MPSTTTYRQGEVVLVSFPFTDLTSTKRRPAVVVSPDTFNARNVASHYRPNGSSLRPQSCLGVDAGGPPRGNRGGEECDHSDQRRDRRECRAIVN